MFHQSYRTSPASQPVLSILGPNAGQVGVASTNFIVTLSNQKGGNVVVTPSSNGGGGTFTPTSLTLSGSTTSGTFTFTPASTGTVSISISNNRGFTQIGSPINYTATGTAATTVTLSGPTSGLVNTASTNFTVTANGALSGVVVVTPNDSSGGGTFSPTTVSLSPGVTSGTFTYTPTSFGTKSINIANNGGLSNAGIPISYVVTSSGTLFTYTMKSALGGQQPTIPIGFALPQGVASDVTVSGFDSYQVIVRRRWNDGTAKHVVVYGRATYTAGVAKSFTVSSGTSPTSGTPLTQANIPAAARNAYSVDCSGIGTAVFNPVSDTPIRTWRSSSECTEWHFRKDIGNNLWAVMQFQLWYNFKVRVKFYVVNGTLDNGAGGAATGIADQTYVPTFVVNGSTVWNNSGTSLTHRKHTSYQAASSLSDGWFWHNDQTDPAFEPGHNVNYLDASKMIPHYGWRSPDATTLNNLFQNYVPMANGPIAADDAGQEGSTGDQPQIAYLPLWDSLFCTSGDIRAYKSVLVGSSSVRSYPIMYHVKASQAGASTADGTYDALAKPSLFPTWDITGPTGGGEDNLSDALYKWDSAHHGSHGYLAYLLTDDYWHYETMAMQATIIYFMAGNSKGNGTSRLMQTHQTRAHGWELRTLGQFCAIIPDIYLGAGSIGAEYRTMLKSNYDSLNTIRQSADTKVWSGCLYSYGYNGWSLPWSGNTTIAGSFPPWQVNFAAMSHGLNSDMEPLLAADMVTMRAVRDHVYKWSIGLAGIPGCMHDYDFTRSGNYGIRVTMDGGTTWLQSWGEIFTSTYQSGNTVYSNVLTGAGGNRVDIIADQNYHAVQTTCLAIATDHGVPGAADAWLRYINSTNFTAGANAGLNNSPKFGVAPRTTPTATTVPYTLPTAANSSVLVNTPGFQSLNTVAPVANYNGSGTFEHSVFGSYCGATFIKKKSYIGAFVKTDTGGHVNPTMNGVAWFDFSTGLWNYADNGNGMARHFETNDILANTGDPFWEYSGAGITAGMPCSSHQFNHYIPTDRGPNGTVYMVGRDAVSGDGNKQLSTVHSQDLSNYLWTRRAGTAPGNTNIIGHAAIDPGSPTGIWNAYYGNRATFDGLSGNFFNFVAYYDLLNQVWSNTTPNYPFPPASSGDWGSFFVHDPGRVLVYHDVNRLLGLDLNNIAAGWKVLNCPTLPTSHGNQWIWHPVNQKYYAVLDDQVANTLDVLTPPASAPMTSAWSYQSITISGAGRAINTNNQAGSGAYHYGSLQYVPFLNILSWIWGSGAPTLINVSAAAAPKTYTTTFPLTENPISESGVWTNAGVFSGKTNVKTASGNAFGTMAGFDGTNFIDSGAHLSGFTANHKVTVTFFNDGTYHSGTNSLETEILLRADFTSGHTFAYEVDCYLGGGGIALNRWDSTTGSPNAFSNPPLRAYVPNEVAFANGDQLEASISGTVITVRYKPAGGSFSTLFTYNTAGDSIKYSTGNPGMGFWNETGSAANAGHFAWSDFTATDI